MKILSYSPSNCIAIPLNPINGRAGRPSPEEVDLNIKEKLKEFLMSEGFQEACQRILKNVILKDERAV